MLSKAQMSPSAAIIFFSRTKARRYFTFSWKKDFRVKNCLSLHELFQNNKNFHKYMRISGMNSCFDC